jgi:hypothetical protein
MDNNPVPNVLLVGGPSTLAVRERLLHVEDVEKPLSVAHNGGHEHFAPNGRIAHRNEKQYVVFGWRSRDSPPA